MLIRRTVVAAMIVPALVSALALWSAASADHAACVPPNRVATPAGTPVATWHVGTSGNASQPMIEYQGRRNPNWNWGSSASARSSRQCGLLGHNNWQPGAAVGTRRTETTNDYSQSQQLDPGERVWRVLP